MNFKNLLRENHSLNKYPFSEKYLVGYNLELDGEKLYKLKYF